LGWCIYDSESESVPLRPHLGRWPVGGRGCQDLNVTLLDKREL
jgi:hypothetical protein